jgi:hypothetical protein
MGLEKIDDLIKLRDDARDRRVVRGRGLCDERSMTLHPEGTPRRGYVQRGAPFPSSAVRICARLQ